MKFRCERDVLADVLATAGRAATGRTGTLPVLSGVRIDLQGDRLQVTGTDLELTIDVEVTVDGNADGVTVLPARLTADIVRSLSHGAVAIEVDQDDVHISAGRSQFQVRPLSADDFPRRPEFAAEAVTLPVDSFGAALRQVARAASSDESRPMLTGVLLAAEDDGLRLVATDSYRLAVRDLPGTTVLARRPEGARAVAGAERAGPVGAVVGPDHAATRRARGHLRDRLGPAHDAADRRRVPELPPAHPAALPEPAHRRARGTAGGGRAASSSWPATPPRSAWPCRADGLELTAITQDIGQAVESLDAKYEGAEMMVAFNPDYLSAGVDAVTSDEVVLETLDALKPAVLRAADANDFLYLLMPVRVP